MLRLNNTVLQITQLCLNYFSILFQAETQQEIKSHPLNFSVILLIIPCEIAKSENHKLRNTNFEKGII